MYVYWVLRTYEYSNILVLVTITRAVVQIQVVLGSSWLGLQLY